MAGLDDILKVLPIDQIAARLGVDPATATQAVQQGGGAILSGLQQNAATPEGASALQSALGKHTGLGDHVDLDQVDTTDGGKILRHVFGGREQEVAKALTDEPRDFLRAGVLGLGLDEEQSRTRRRRGELVHDQRPFVRKVAP
ncbi:MAG: DUF937 domain-containing protein [Microbacterium sp.]|nr:MAG: DUF937 domain-containing protein [Microbacterium sp.]